MDIAYVTETYPPEINGVALTVARTVGFLRARGHRVLLVRPRQRGEARQDGAGEWRTPGLPIPMYPELRFGLAGTAQLARRFSAGRPQLVHVATQGPLGRAALLAAERLGIPASTDFRTNFHWYSRYYRLGGIEPLVASYLRRFHGHADVTFVPTEATRRLLEAERFVRVEVQGRGVDGALFAPARRSAALRAEWLAGAAPDAPVLLYVGRLAAEKNVRLALAAFEAVRARRPEARMVVVGEGPLRRALEAEFPAARFVGLQRGAALAAHYASADLFLFPSLSETFGNVTLEAMASGLAVLAFDAAAAQEHLRHGESGLLAAPGDDAGFIELACRAACELALVARLRGAARTAAQTVQWELVLGRLESRLLRLAERGARPQAPGVALA